MQKQVDTYVRPPHKTKRARREPRTPLPATQPTPPPQDGGSLPVSATGAPAPQPQRALQVHSRGAPPAPELFQAGETESGSEMPGAGRGWKGQMRKALAPQAPGRSQRSRGEPPACPGLRGEGAGGAGSVGRRPGGPGEAGLQFFTEEADGGLASGRGRGGGSCQA